LIYYNLNKLISIYISFSKKKLIKS
jgi:hypothetical protein